MSNVLAFKQKHAETPEATGKGFALIHRQFMDSRLYKDSQAVHLWFHFIMRASHKASLVETHLGQISVGRGQFITGRPTLVDETGIPDRRIRTLMEKFERMGMICSEPFGRSFSRISVLKYDEYQPENRPIKSLESSNETPHAPRLPEQFEPTESQRKAKDNELLTNNSISKDIECATPAAKQAEPRQRISCEEVWQCLKEELPEARGWRVMDEDRRNLIKRFWGKANKIARQFDNGEPLTMDGFRSYLQYISANCRWMLEDRPDNRTGKTWRRMKFDSFLSEKLYRDVREGDKDDR